MSKELSYLNSDGQSVFTSQFHKNRGTCCKTTCLHCPYGFTLKKMGLQFQDVNESHVPEIERILEEASYQVAWRDFFPENLKLVTLKGVTCGLILKNHIVVKHLVLLPMFQEQNISKELVESYYFI